MNTHVLDIARRFRSNALISTAAATGAMRSLNIVLGFFVMILVANGLGAHDFGLFAFAISIAALGSVVMRSGLPLFIVREGAAAAAKNDWSRYHAAMRFSTVAGLTVSASVVVLLFVIFAFPVSQKSSEFVLPGIVGAIGACIMTFNILVQARLRAAMEVTRAYASEFLVMQGSMFVMILALWLYDGLSLNTVLAAFLSSWLMASATSIYWWRKYRPAFSSSPEQKLPWARWWRATGALFLLGGTFLVVGKVEALFLAAVAGPTAIGCFVLAFRIASVTSVAGAAVSSFFSPALSKMNAIDGNTELPEQIRTATVIDVSASILIAVGVSVFSWGVIPLVAPDLSEVRYLTPIIAAGYVVASLAGRSFDMAAMLGSAKGATAAAAITLPLYVVMLFLVTPVFYEVGAAIVTAGTIAFYAILLNVIVYRETGMRSDLLAVTIAPIATSGTPPHKAAE